MAQTPWTVGDLITHALLLTGELGVGETADAFMFNTGLELLNAKLDEFSMDGINIPYYTDINFTMTPGQHTYSVSNIVSADINANRIIELTWATYDLINPSPETITIPLTIISQANFFGIPRLPNLETRPCYIFLNNVPQQSTVEVYPTPDQPYPTFLRCKLMLNSFANVTDVLSQLQPYHYKFLKYCLAREFLGYYPSANWPQTNEDEFQRMYLAIQNANPTDLTITPSIVLDAPQPFYWPNILAY